MAFSNILVVIDPTVDEQPALRRAEQIAIDTGASLHLLCCSYEDDFSEYASRKDAKHSCLEDLAAQLNQCAEPLRKEGIKVTKETYWNADWRNSIVRVAREQGSDLIVKSYSRHNPLKRHLVANSDFTLMRDSSCATLLVKSDEAWQNQTALAAIALDEGDQEHKALNSKILALAKQLSEKCQLTLHLLSVFKSTEAASECLCHDRSADGEDLQRALGGLYGIDEDRAHVSCGKASAEIVARQQQLKTDLLIVGTVGRKGIEGVLVGNTAEKVLDQTDCDILVINP